MITLKQESVLVAFVANQDARITTKTTAHVYVRDNKQWGNALSIHNKKLELVIIVIMLWMNI